MNTTAAVAVREISGVAEARRLAVVAADRAGFDETAAGRVALVVTELATNLARHARDGEILVRRLDSPSERGGIEVIAIDKGPGIPDVALARRDGHSTAGTLGHGLGAVERQSDECHLYTAASGTAIMARFYGPQSAGPSGAPDLRAERPLDVGGVLVSKPEEHVCGDGWAWRLDRNRLAVAVADGLGHGLQACDAAAAALRTFATTQAGAPAEVLGHIHTALRSTRGAAIAVLSIDLDRSLACYAGAGNISAALVPPSGTRQGMVSMNGTAGHVLARIQEFRYPVIAGSSLVLHSDGISAGWDLAAYPGLRTRHPSLVAAVLYRDFARRRDDASAVVIQQRS